VPADARIRILNIKPKFEQGIELEAGPYHIEVSAEDYIVKKQLIDLKAGRGQPHSIRTRETYYSLPWPSGAFQCF